MDWLTSGPCLACDERCEHETWTEVAIIRGPDYIPDPESTLWRPEEAQMVVDLVNAFRAATEKPPSLEGK